MISKRRRILVLLFVTILCAIGLFVARDTVVGVVERTFVYDTYVDWELSKVRESLAKGSLTGLEARGRLIEVARKNPGTQAKVGALSFIARRWPDSAEATEALTELPIVVEETTVDDLASCFDRTTFGNAGLWKGRHRRRWDSI